MKEARLVNKKIKSKVDWIDPYKIHKYLLAVSGGPDSQCLLKAFSHVVDPERCVAIGVNHGLRKEADSELDLAETLALSVGIKFERVRLKLKKGSNMQARARNARYEALRTEARRVGAKFIVTGHHFDDRAETVLIRLLRGNGLGSLAVMPMLSWDVFRPMLGVSRKEIEAYLLSWNIPYATDPSNSDTAYMRTKIRHEILPLLEKINPQIRTRLNDLSDELLNDWRLNDGDDSD